MPRVASCSRTLRLNGSRGRDTVAQARRHHPRGGGGERPQEDRGAGARGALASSMRQVLPLPPAFEGGIPPYDLSGFRDPLVLLVTTPIRPSCHVPDMNLSIGGLAKIQSHLSILPMGAG